MKSRTSFFDKTVLRKDITRFAPLWGLYLIGGLLIAITVASLEGKYYSIARMLSNVIGPFGVISIVYALLNAQLLFGDLFNTRLCNALHAMPLRREGWFFTHVTAGMLFSLVPNAIIALVLMPMTGKFWYTALLWLLGMEIHYLFFFGLAVFCMLLTGNRFAAAAVYTIINFLSLIVMWFATVVFQPLMYGVVIRDEVFTPYCPVVKLCMLNEFFEVEHDPSCMCKIDKYFYQFENGGEHLYRFNGLTDNWWYPVILAGLGIILGAVALLLYRRRHLETAGDFMAFKGVKPVFTVVYTLCAGACLQLIGNLFGDPVYIFMVIGLIVGYFTSQMLLNRSLRVFKARNWLCAALFLVVVFGSLGLCKIDVFGITRWTPDADDVVEVKVADSRVDEFTKYNTDATLSDPENIKRLIAIHQLLYAEGPYEDRNTDAGYQNLTICYTLKDGRQVYRQYKATQNGKAAQAIDALIFKNPIFALRADSAEKLVENVANVQIDYMSLRGASIPSLLEALWADAEAGTLLISGTYKPEGEHVCNISLNYKDGSGISFSIFDNNVNTTAWLKEHLPDSIGFEGMLELTASVNIDGHLLNWDDAVLMEEFCDLLYVGIQNGTVVPGVSTNGHQVALYTQFGVTYRYTVAQQDEKLCKWIQSFQKGFLKE